jgi:peptidoglycan hydrolase-like protein with peptidoglycan-binding domain/3D (Asp-Asp-Asp) domain-containing protein
MKKTKTNIVFRNLLVLDFLLLFSVFLVFKPFDAAFADKAFAEELNGTDNVDASDAAKFPYLKTFIISAYYSPLPCQDRYATGSYKSDIRLNGNGTNGADGTEVFPGMIAAPKTYSFGTKMDIPGIGIVAVHDRGGAIVAASTGAFAYDRLDVWMGYGDKGLDRALSWGKRTVDVEVYGINDAIAEQVSLGDYDASESTPKECSNVDVAEPEIEKEVEKVAEKVAEKPVSKPVTLAVKKQSAPVKSIDFLDNDLKPGDEGEKVKELQKELKKLNFYRTDISGVYDATTKHAVFKFQQVQGLVMDEESEFAGIFGPKTRKGLNSLVAASNYTETKVAVATENYQKTMLANAESDKPKKTLISLQLKYGMRGPEVASLQKFLKDQGFIDGDLITEYYGPLTQNAVTEFQKAHKLITTPNDNGAGYVGPATLELINNLS